MNKEYLSVDEKSMEPDKSNKVLIWSLVILSLLVVGLGGYIVYDKFITDTNIEEKDNDGGDGNTEKTTPSQLENGKEYTSDFSGTTNDWVSFDVNNHCKYSFILPNEYLLDNTVIYKNDEKVAELMPAIKINDGYKMPKNLTEYENQLRKEMENSEYSIDEVIAEIYDSDFFTQGDFEVMVIHKQTEACGFQTGSYCQVWYPHSFYIKKNDIIFQITFYTLEKEVDADLFNLYKEIALSFKLV